MEFILVSGALAARQQLLEKACLQAKRIMPIDGDFHFFSGNGLFVAGASPLETQGSLFFWDGHGMDGKCAFSSGTIHKPDIQELKAYHEAVCRGGGNSQIRGVFTSLMIDKEATEFSVTVDPLFQYSLFIWQMGNSLCVSNSIYLIEAIANAVGARLTRSPYVGCFEVACSVGSGLRTGYHDVSVQPFGKIVKGRGDRFEIVDSKFNPVPDRASYGELLSLSAERLMSYTAAINTAFPKDGVVYDLTGGQDSRVCFAAAIGAGVKGLNFFVGGDDGDDDLYVARQLANSFGAKEANFPENYTENFISANEQARRAVFRQQGHSTLYHYALGKGRLDTVARIRGGAGELSRSHLTDIDDGSFLLSNPIGAIKKLVKRDTAYRESLAGYWHGIFDEKHRIAARWAYKLSGSYGGQRQVFTETFKECVIRSLIHDHYDNAETINSMGVDTYFKDRTRRHFAFVARALNYSSGAFELLYDPVMIAAAQALPWEDRASGRFIFDLLEKMAGPDILKVPYAQKSMQPKPQKYLAARLGCSVGAITAVNRKTMPATQRTQVKTGCSMNQWAEYDGPKNMGIHGKYLWQNKHYMEELASGLPMDHEVWELLKRDQFLAAMQGDHFFGTDFLETRGMRFLHMLIWLAGEESSVGVTEII